MIITLLILSCIGLYAGNNYAVVTSGADFRFYKASYFGYDVPLNAEVGIFINEDSSLGTMLTIGTRFPYQTSNTLVNISVGAIYKYEITDNIKLLTSLSFMSEYTQNKNFIFGLVGTMKGSFHITEDISIMAGASLTWIIHQDPIFYITPAAGISVSF